MSSFLQLYRFQRPITPIHLQQMVSKGYNPSLDSKRPTDHLILQLFIDKLKTFQRKANEMRV